MDAYPHYKETRRPEYYGHNEQVYQTTLRQLQTWSVDFRTGSPPPSHHPPHHHHHHPHHPPHRPLPGPPLRMATIPISSYEHAIEYLKLCCEQSNLRANERIPIDLSICDVEGLVQKHRIPGKLFLTSSSSLMGVIMAAQLEVDIVGDTIYHNNAKAPGVLKEKLLICGFNIIIGDAMAGMPTIAGDLFGTDSSGKMCKFVRWYCDGGAIQQYWEQYRNWLLKVGNSASTPALFKIFTVKRDGVGQIGMSSGGHHFMRHAEPVMLMENMSLQNDFVGHETPRDTYDGRSNAQQEPASHETPALETEMKSRTHYTREQMEEMLRSAPPGKKLEHQPPIAVAEVILGILVSLYYKQFDDVPSFEEMEDMQEEIRANGFGTRPVLTMMEDESKNAEIPDTPTKVPKQTEQTQNRYYKQSDAWSAYQKKPEDPRLQALYSLDYAQYQPSVVPEFLEPNHPEYEDPVDKAKSKGKERDVRDIPGGRIDLISFDETTKYEAYILRDERAIKIRKDCGKYDEEYAASKGFEDADDETFLAPESAGEDDDAADEKNDGPSSESKALVRTNVAEEIQASQTEQYSQYAVPSYNNTGYGGSSSGYNNYSTGGNQYQPAPYGRNSVFNQLHSSTPTRADHGGFPQYNYNYSTTGQTNFNPAAASWNSGGQTGGGYTVGHTGGGQTGAHTLSGNPTSRYIFDPTGTASTFNPNVATFQSQTNQVNPIVPSFQPKTIGNMLNPLQHPHNQANTSFVAGNHRNANPFGLPGPNPFAMKYPLRFEGPGTPVNPNHRPTPVSNPVGHTVGHAVGHPLGQKPKQSTPLKEFITNEEENIAPGAAGDMQYGTSMRLYNTARGSNSKSTLSAILNAEPSSSGAAHPSGFGQTMGSGPTIAAASGQAPGSSALPFVPGRRNNKNRHNRGGSAGDSGGRGGGGASQTG